jgi:hypothetical protein
MLSRGSLFVFLALLCGCECASAPTRCTSSAGCPAGERCVDGACLPPDAGVDAATRDAGLDGGADGGGCPSRVLCGPALVCCAEGEECVVGACRAACASGVRCGGALEECCAAGDVCSGTCVTPGAACDFSFDCAASERCEPTLGRCLSRPAAACEYRPPVGTFAPIVEWEWTASTTEPGSDQVVVTPVVASFTDDDLDGDVDRRDVPDVAFVTFQGLSPVGRLRLASGDDGREHWTAARPVCAYAGIAAGDLEGDGTPEILAAGLTGSSTCRSDAVPILAFRADGTLLWESHDAGGAPVGFRVGLGGSPSIANLDADPEAEIAVAGGVIDADGRVLWNVAPDLGANYASGSPISIVADVDGDGMPEVIGGNAAYRADGTPMWRDATRQDGFPAIGRFGIAPGGGPELAIVSFGVVYLRDATTGALVWGPITHPGGNYGGPPTIADFDGDGMPEIGVAGLTNYVVYDTSETDGILWTFATIENGAAITGSSVFDFEGDGRAEVVYADQCFLRALDGATGAVLFAGSSSSGTHAENPVIADLDQDGHAEILVATNSLSSASCTGLPGFTGFTHGLRVFGDAGNNWVPTRRIWNQHAYHITNVSEDARVPVREAASWSRFNSYRQNAQDDALYAPDLVVSDVQADLRACPARLVLRARITNAGSAGAPAGVSVAFYEGATLLGTALTTEALLPGTSTWVELDIPVATPETVLDVNVVVDDDGSGAGAFHECDESNNARARPSATCNVLI